MLVHLLLIARRYVLNGDYARSEEIDGETAGSL
jgi:hypothetical protein